MPKHREDKKEMTSLRTLSHSGECRSKCNGAELAAFSPLSLLERLQARANLRAVVPLGLVFVF